MTPDRLEPHGLGKTEHKAKAQVGHNRLVMFVTLYEYRGPLKRFADGAFVACDPKSKEPGCQPPASFPRDCVD